MNVVVAQPRWYGLTVLKANKPIFLIIHGTYRNELKFSNYKPIKLLEKLRYIYGIKLSHKNEMNVIRTLYHSRGGHANIIAVSAKAAEEVSTETGARNIASILNGVDKDLFRPIDKGRAGSHLERKRGVRFRGYVMAHVGLGPRKGTRMLVKALALKKMRLEFTVLFVGKLGPASYRRHVWELNRRFDLNVKFLGWIPDEDLPYVYSASDLTATSSYSEGAPLMIPESLAYGTP